MNTKFDKERAVHGPAVERKASWTYEDRDYIWLNRLTYVLNPAGICILLLGGIPIMFEALDADGLRQAAIFIAIAVWSFFGTMAVTMLRSKYERYLESRFPFSRVRYLYSRPYFDNTTLEYLRGPGDNDRREAIEQRDAALAPLRDRVARYKKLFRGVAIAQFTAGIVCIIWVHSPAVPGAPAPLVSAIGILLLLGSLLSMPAWQIMIYDLPARWNPMYASTKLPAAMEELLQDACDDDGAIWIVDHMSISNGAQKIVPRGLFKTPFGPLLFGDDWSSAPLPLGLWQFSAHIRKDVSKEIAAIISRNLELEAELMEMTSDQKP